jgi:hypothetical protein
MLNLIETISVTSALRPTGIVLVVVSRLPNSAPQNLQFITITKSCEAALRKFRDLGIHTYFWIDSVCIYSYRNTITYFGSVRAAPQVSLGFNLHI